MMSIVKNKSVIDVYELKYQWNEFVIEFVQGCVRLDCPIRKRLCIDTL